MGKQVFIPLTDEIFFDRPELISSPLRPYSLDLPCLHWLEVEINPSDVNNIGHNFGHNIGHNFAGHLDNIASAQALPLMVGPMARPMDGEHQPWLKSFIRVLRRHKLIAAYNGACARLRPRRLVN